MVKDDLITNSLEDVIASHDYRSSEWAINPHVRGAAHVYQTALQYAKILRIMERKQGGISKNEYTLFEECVQTLETSMKQSLNPRIREYAESFNDLYESMRTISRYDKVGPFSSLQLEQAKIEFEVAASQFVFNPNHQRAVKVYGAVGRYKDALTEIKRKNGEVSSFWVMNYLREVQPIRQRIAALPPHPLTNQLTTLITLNEEKVRGLLETNKP